LLSATAIDGLKECIRTADRVAAKRMADLAASIQLQSARLRSFLSDNEETGAGEFWQLETSRRIIDAARVYGLASSLFDYGRRRVNEADVELSRAELISALNNMQFINDDVLEQLVGREDGRPLDPIA
jgi:hypothetical protein